MTYISKDHASVKYAKAEGEKNIRSNAAGSGGELVWLYSFTNLNIPLLVLFLFFLVLVVVLPVHGITNN